MEPITKKLLSTVMSTINKLETNTIDPEKAKATSRLVGEANALLNYELKRAVVITKHADVLMNLRDIES